MNTELVILVHGFNNGEADMYPMQQYLKKRGYIAVTVNLPLRFLSLEKGIAEFENQFKQIEMEYGFCGKIHLVGYSMGGLVVRAYLAKHLVPKLGRCLLIATPNNGTKLADWAHKFLKPMVHIFKPLIALKSGALTIGKPVNLPHPDIGVIAGNTSKYILGMLLAGENDGRVEVDSARYDDMADFIIKPYGHKEIHHKQDIADLVEIFLKSGRFPHDQ
ncbi:MAG: alpha/beta fold hydrolase [Syntrophomonadaceae bacterium]|nr:alpha/beta fold hydrolase [Syntrophomonadaceae bacterium]